MIVKSNPLPKGMFLECYNDNKFHLKMLVSTFLALFTQYCYISTLHNLINFTN